MYLIATKVPDASCWPSTTWPDPPEPSAFSSVYPGTPHSATQIAPFAGGRPARETGRHAALILG